MKGILYVSRKMEYPIAIIATVIVASEANQEQRKPRFDKESSAQYYFR